jgi:hypothetical protein
MTHILNEGEQTMPLDKRAEWAFTGGGGILPSARMRRRVSAKMMKLGRKSHAEQIASAEFITAVKRQIPEQADAQR